VQVAVINAIVINIVPTALLKKLVLKQNILRIMVPIQTAFGQIIWNQRLGFKFDWKY